MKALSFLKDYLAEWLQYTPHFFRNAPVKMWWDYFGSSHRVIMACISTRDFLNGIDDPMERHAERIKMMATAQIKLGQLAK